MFFAHPRELHDTKEEKKKINKFYLLTQMISECFPSENVFFFADSVYETLPLVQLLRKAVDHQLSGSRYYLYTYNIKEMCD